jgi:hypothetical protein
MIELNSEEMNTMMKKVDTYLTKRFVFCENSWLKDKIKVYKNNSKIEEQIYKDVIESDIKTFIDNNRLKEYYEISEKTNFQIKQYRSEKSILMQISGYSNIAESSENANKSSDNLDVLENFESKYLQSEGEENKKTEKVILKFDLTDGIDTYHGFEYECLNELKSFIKSSENKYPKILILPTTEIRRGIFYLQNDLLKLL